MESGLYGDGKLILALIAICSHTWQVGKRLDRDTEVAAHPATASIVSYPVDPPCYGIPRQTQFKSNKIPAFAVTRVMANVLRSERIDQVESFSFVGRFKVQTTPVAALCYELADDTCASGKRNVCPDNPFLISLRPYRQRNRQ